MSDQVAKLIGVTKHELCVDDWIATGVLSGLRKASNDKIRNQNRTRGDTKDQLNDTIGALAELMALRTCEKIKGASVEHCLFDPRGPVEKQSDLTLRRRRTLHLEAKGHFFAPQKRLFLVNEVAFQRSLKRGAEGFVPVVAAEGSLVAYTGRIILIGALEQVAPCDYGYDDPARPLPLGRAMPEYFERKRSEIEREVTGTAQADFAKASEEAFKVGRAVYRRAKATGLVLGATFEEARDDLVRIFRESKAST